MLGHACCLILGNAILVEVSSSASSVERPAFSFVLGHDWSMGCVLASFVSSSMAGNPNHISVVGCCSVYELLSCCIRDFFLGLVVSPFECLLLEAAFAISTSLDMVGCPWELWWELITLKNSLDALFEICDGFTCSWKRFLFVWPCLLFRFLFFLGRYMWLVCRFAGFWKYKVGNRVLVAYQRDLRA